MSPFWILLKLRTVDMIVTTGAILTTNKPIPRFSQARCHSCRPTTALKGRRSHSTGLLTPSSPVGLPTLSLTTKGSWLPWGWIDKPLVSPLTPTPKIGYCIRQTVTTLCSTVRLIPLLVENRTTNGLDVPAYKV